jgi:cbb3-type cytochrome oxidase subunit 3
MLSIENYIEIQIVGFLLFFAITPFINIFIANYRKETHLCPLFKDITETSAKIVLIIIIAFTLGAVGNRLIDDFIDDVLEKQGNEEYKKIYKTWAEENNKLSDKDAKVSSLKLAEFELSANEMARGYLDRHKFLMRVLRGAAFAFLLLSFSMFVYRMFVYIHKRKHINAYKKILNNKIKQGRWEEDKNKWKHKMKRYRLCINRYPRSYILAALFLCFFCFWAFRSESLKYYERVCELYTKIPDCNLCKYIPECKDCKESWDCANCINNREKNK